MRWIWSTEWNTSTTVSRRRSDNENQLARPTWLARLGCVTIQVNIQEAKTRLSQLLAAAEGGEEVVIARDGKPIVRLSPLADPPPRPVGFVPGSVGPEFFEPLPDDELAAWE